MANIVEQWSVDSDSSPGSSYRVSLLDDGSYSCACKGWTMHTPRRDCKHIAVVKAGFGRSVDPLVALVVKSRHAEERRRANLLARSPLRQMVERHLAASITPGSE